MFNKIRIAMLERKLRRAHSAYMVALVNLVDGLANEEQTAELRARCNDLVDRLEELGTSDCDIYRID